MPKFTDGAGREWIVTFSAGSIKRCRDELGVDLAKLSENEFRNYLDVAGDPVKLADVMYVMCRSQHPEVKLDEFYEIVGGEVIELAADAFQEAFLSFCPSRQREALRALAAKQVAMEATVIQAVMESLSAQAAPSSTTAINSPE